MTSDDSGASNTPSRTKDEVWELTEQWMAKITTAYENYNKAVKHFHQTVVIALAAFVGCVLIVVAVSSYRGVVLDATFIGVVTAIGFGVTILIAVGCAFDAISARSNVKTSMSDLADIYLIANELFQMVISTEEKNMSNRYEYLVNHIRILEIRHLLRKVRRIVESIVAGSEYEGRRASLGS